MKTALYYNCPHCTADVEFEIKELDKLKKGNACCG